MVKALILLSGGLDSSTLLAIAKNGNYECHTLSFDYGQRHLAELDAAEKIAEAFAVIEHSTIKLDLTPIGGSALIDKKLKIPRQPTDGIPITYVPARNTIFLSYALAWAEVRNINNIFIGVNAVDYSGYPDCRPEFIRAFAAMANLATKASVEGTKLTIHTPLIHLGKAEIIQTGIKLNVDYSLTISCYRADKQRQVCGVCDACRLRAAGFAEAGIPDPAL